MDEPRVGRELDALVAERVMGYVWRNGVSGRLLIEPGSGGALLYPENADMSRPLVPDATQYREMFRFSANIADAWQVVERFHGQGCNVDINNDVGTGKWWCRLSLDNIGYNRSGNAAPEAICRAALMVADNERKEA